MSELTPVQYAEYYIGTFNPTDSGEVDSIKQNAKQMIITIQNTCPPGRRRSAACTHVEEAAMLAVKSLVDGA